MASAGRSVSISDRLSLPILANDMPILYEDEEEADVGESNPHVDADEILHICLKAHLRNHPELAVYSNMNLYYRKGRRQKKSQSLPYISPDDMVVRPYRALGEDVSSYTIGLDGPPPLLAAEVLSERSAQERDLDDKLVIYANLGVPEYLLVDLTGRYLAERLLLKRLQPNRTWRDERDPDGGVTSQLGFRAIIEKDGRLRLLNAATGRPYVRPDEAEQRIRTLEEELSR